jgi:hypothetical protein
MNSAFKGLVCIVCFSGRKNEDLIKVRILDGKMTLDYLSGTHKRKTRLSEEKEREREKRMKEREKTLSEEARH